MELRVASRFDVTDGHTLAGYQDSGTYRGYDGLRAALAMAPGEVSRAVRQAVMQSGVTNARAPSWIRTCSSPAPG